MYRRTRTSLVVTIATALAATSAGSIVACDDDDVDNSITGTGTLVSPVTSDANIVALTHESNLGEIQAGTVASQRATNTDVRAFAAMMVVDHTTLDTAGMSLAARNGITPALPDSALPRLQAQEMAALQGAAAGTSFDRAYVAQQVTAHQRTLALVDTSIVRAQNAALRTMLQNQVRPAVAAHLQTARNLQTQVGTP
jgi:putative membrane protein